MCIRQVEIERERCKCVSLGMRGNRECVWSLTDHDVKAQTSQHQLATETQEAQAHLMSSITTDAIYHKHPQQEHLMI